MKKAYQIFWWNRKDGKENEELHVIIITDNVTKIFDLFMQEFPKHDVNFITNIESREDVIIVE